MYEMLINCPIGWRVCPSTPVPVQLWALSACFEWCWCDWSTRRGVCIGSAVYWGTIYIIVLLVHISWFLA